MSAITTWGWGEQGGLVSSLGWGGTPSDAPIPIPVPYKPCLKPGVRLVPELEASRNGKVPQLSSSAILTPKLNATNGRLRPAVSSSERLRPAISTDDAERPEIATSERLAPKFSSAGRDLRPELTSERMVPQVDAETEEKPEITETMTVKPKTDTDDGSC